MARRRRAPRGWWLVAGVALASYANALNNGYVYDSIQIVERNPLVNGLRGWGDIWRLDHWYMEEGRTADRDLLYRPITIASYRLTRLLAGPGPLPQHLVNVLLHAAVSVLVVILARYSGLSDSVALTAGALFAVLPIHTEVIDDVVGRTDLLATLFVLLTLIVHRRLTNADSSSKQLGWGALSAVSAFCALGAKESGVSVLGVVLLFDAWWCCEARRAGRPVKWLSTATISRLTYVVIPAIAYVVLRYQALGRRLFEQPSVSKTINPLVTAPVWQHILGVLQAWGMYWRKTVWPAVLCPDYSANAVHLATSPWELDVVVGAAVAVALLIASMRAWRRGNGAIALCAAGVLLCFLPASNAFVLIHVFFAERIWYMPSVWAVILMAAAVVSLCGVWEPRSARLHDVCTLPPTESRAGERSGDGYREHVPGDRLRGTVLVSVNLLMISAMLARCLVRNPEWRSNATLAAAAYRDHPDSVATLTMYGNLLATSGDVSEGSRLLERAVEIDPGFTVAHRALGQAYMLAGDADASLLHWRIAEMQFPGHPDSQAALRILTGGASADDRAELQELRQAADGQQANLRAELAYLRKLVELARYEDALDRLQANSHAYADDAAWQQQYGTVLLFAGDREGAIQKYRNAHRLAPDDVDPIVDLVALLMNRQQDSDLTEAQNLLASARTLARHDPYVEVLCAELLALQGDVRAALDAYRDLLDSLPADHPQRALWESRARVLGKK